MPEAYILQVHRFAQDRVHLGRLSREPRLSRLSLGRVLVTRIILAAGRIRRRLPWYRVDVPVCRHQAIRRRAKDLIARRWARHQCA